MQETHARLCAAPGSRAALDAVASGAFAAPLLASGALGMRIAPGRAATLDLLLLDAAKRLRLAEAPLLFVRPCDAPDVLYLALPADLACGDAGRAGESAAAVVVSSAAIATYSHWELQAAMAAALSAHAAAPAAQPATAHGPPSHRKARSSGPVPVATIATALSLAIIAPDVLDRTLPPEARAVWGPQARALLREATGPVQLCGDRCALLVAQDLDVVGRMVVQSRCGASGAFGAERCGTLVGHTACAGDGPNDGTHVDVVGLRLRELERWAQSAQFAGAMADVLPQERASGSSHASC